MTVAPVIVSAAREAAPTALRRCIVTREARPRRELLRFVVGPDGSVVPDVDGTLPARGLWLLPQRDILSRACAGRVFAKVAGCDARTPDDLSERVEEQLVRRCVSLIGLARRAGMAVVGYERARLMLRSGRAAALIGARDGADGGRRRLRALASGLPVIELLNRAEIGGALGCDEAVHVVLAVGRISDRFVAEAIRLGGFRALQNVMRADST